MALEIDLEIKNELLNKSLVDIESSTMYLSIPSPRGSDPSSGYPSVEIKFNRSTNGMLKLSSPVYIVVPAGTTIDAMYISLRMMLNSSFDSIEKDIIRITGNDIVTHTVNGIHVIEEINIGAATL